MVFSRLLRNLPVSRTVGLGAGKGGVVVNPYSYTHWVVISLH